MLVTVRSSSASSTAEGVLGASFEVTLDCVVIADASGRVVEFDPAPERTFAYAREALARRSTVPAELNLAVDRRLPTSIEIAAYCVASKALANAVNTLAHRWCGRG
jgi:ABC-type Fe3+-hydroxamate transport system substrate-binding protein